MSYTGKGTPANVFLYDIEEGDTLLHRVVRLSQYLRKENQSYRKDVCPEEEFLQCAVLGMRKGQTFKPHQHRWKEGEKEVIAQECWVVMEGSVAVTYFNEKGEHLDQKILNKGDMSFTFRGGHTYLSLETNTLVYEFKTGPYRGQEQDKEFI